MPLAFSLNLSFTGYAQSQGLFYDRLPLAEAARAHELLESGTVIGKLLLKP